MEINYTYIHCRKENFLKSIGVNTKLQIDTGVLTQCIRQEYNRMKDSAEQRFNDVIEASPAAENLMSLIASSEDLGTLLEQMIGDNDVYERIKEASIQAAGLSSVLDKIQDATIAAEELNNFLISLDNIILDFNKIDQSLIDYYATLAEGSSQRESMNLSFGDQNLKILNINKTAITSMKALSDRIQLLKNAANSSGFSKDTKVTYINSKGISKTVPVTQAIYPLRQLIINILGGLGEGLTALRIIKEADALIEDFQKKIEGIPGLTVKVSGEGTNKLISGKVSKSDVSITYSDINATVTAGISAKAQLHKTGSSITTFQTSKLKEFLTSSIMSAVQYQFLNNLYHNRSSVGEQVIMNRYIAAMNFDNAVTGVNIGDNVLFLSYLDEVLSIKDFYDTICKKTNNISQLPNISIKGRAEALKGVYGKNVDGWKDLTPEDKSVLAFQFSKNRRDILLGLQAQIQFKNNF